MEEKFENKNTFLRGERNTRYYDKTLSKSREQQTIYLQQKKYLRLYKKF